MASTKNSTIHYENRILAGLPRNELLALQRYLEPVTFSIRMVLQVAGQPSGYAYFPEAVIASLVSTLHNGSTVEVGIIGRDGVVGLPGVLGSGSTPFDCFIQMPGNGYRIKTNRLTEHFERSPRLRKKLLGFLQAQLVHTGQLAVCNRIHEIQERLARWLLACHDHVNSDELILTHEFLATMLGAPRSTVSLAAGLLRRAGFVEYSRGHIWIRNRTGLEGTACECYAIIRNETDRLSRL